MERDDNKLDAVELNTDDIDIKEDQEAKEENEEKVFPFIPLRGLNIFPNTVLHFDVGREKSVKALEYAIERDKLIFVASQKDESVLIPQREDYYDVGTVVKIKQMLKIQGDSIRVMVEGLYRASIKELVKEAPYLAVTVDKLEVVDLEDDDLEAVAAINVLLEAFAEYLKLNPQIKSEGADIKQMFERPDILCDTIALQLDVDIADKQEVLECANVKERINLLIAMVLEQNEIARLEKEVSDKVQESMNKNQKEYFLREQIKVIQDELGGGMDPQEEASAWLEKLASLNLDPKTKEKIRKEIDKFSKMPPYTQDGYVSRNYIETILDLPWNTSSKLNKDLKKAEKILNEDHYGLDKVKERIIEYLAVIHLSKAIKGPILCLVGPPGVGKTSIAKSIARATGREFIRMSLGGVRDEAEIRGHRRTYVGAIPGRVINGIKESGVNNPVFLFDEVDKIGADFKGDPSDALLEVLDPEQNKTFQDHYLEIPFDLSKVMFITTANSLDTIPRPLLDRMEVIEVSGYTEEEKLNIAQKYLIPKQIKAHGLKKKNFEITDKALHALINDYTRESGVRNLEREIGSLCRKVARKIVSKKGTSFKITPASLEGYLGKKRFRYDVVEGKSEVGLVTGMAWTQVGGDTLFIETQVVPGMGKVELTGQLGDVMQESARAAITFIRSIAGEYGIEHDFYKKYDIHVHVPEGAVPKDGPSAGVTMFTSVMSALTGTPVKKDVAMTGEITLRGKVLPVGGIKEKVLAAHRAGIRTILLPEENKIDIDDIPQAIRKDIKFKLIKEAEEVLEYAFEK